MIATDRAERGRRVKRYYESRGKQVGCRKSVEKMVWVRYSVFGVGVKVNWIQGKIAGGGSRFNLRGW